MEFISSKNIFLLIKDTLGMIDKRAMLHGSKTAYYIYKMLEYKGGYEKYEIADIVILATFHDIGAYETNDFSNLLKFEYKDYMPHSIYGYLFMKYLSPLEELSKILLYHHIDIKQLNRIDYEHKDLATYFNVAEKVDLYLTALGDKFNISLMQKYAGTRFSEEALTLFSDADKRYRMIEKVKSGEYEKELDEITDYLIFANDEKKKYLEMLMYCVGFRGRFFVENEITSLCIAEKLGQKLFLDENMSGVLYYGAILHDIGMLAIPKEIIDAPRKLTNEEIKQLQSHVLKAEQVLRKNSMNEEVIAVVAAHHERADGSGYPRRLSDSQMTKPQKLLQVADVVTGLFNKRSYRGAMSKDEIVEILIEETARGKLNKSIVDIMITFYDEIMSEVEKEAKKMLTTYNKLNTNYEVVSKQFN